MTSVESKSEPFLLTYTEITKQGNSMPSGSGTFQFFTQPTTDSHHVVFYANNQSDNDFFEGLYFAPVNASQTLTCIASNLIDLPDIGKPTSIVNNQGYSQDAFAPYLTNNAFSIAMTNEACSQPRPIVSGDNIYFFAANWNTNKQGIFCYSISKNKTQALMTNTGGTLKGGMLGLPATDGNNLVFLAAKSATDTTDAGIWQMTTGGESLSLSIDLASVDNLQGFGNPQIAQGSIAFVASLESGENYTGAIFRSVPLQTPDNTLYVIETAIQTGDSINPQYKVEGSTPFWPEISYQNGIIAAKAAIHEGNAVIAVNIQNEVSLITTDYSTQSVPGGGWYSGNELATPSVTSDETLLYAAMVEDVGKGFGSTFELFGWNINNEQQLIRLLDGQTYQVGDNTVYNIYLNINCYQQGVLAGHVLLSNEKEGIYTFVLSEPC